jgi:hypothetical protein
VPRAGLNYLDKNRIRRLADAGMDGHEIARNTGIDTALVLVYLQQLKPDDPPRRTRRAPA